MASRSRLVTIQKVCELQEDPGNVRNVCILAHVDHGKTSLADALIAANGIISARMAGKLRYMDSRLEEQERGITMKSSSISLLHRWQEKTYLVNLIDSPGHTDFCGEVSAAAVLCDGVILVIDVVEGVCPQTNFSLRLAWKEELKPCLVLNKVDRLFTEMRMTPLEAYNRLVQVLEQVNAVAGELFVSKELEKQEQRSNGDDRSDSISPESGNDEVVYFLPSAGNVVFASALDNWGFRLQDFAQLWARRLDTTESELRTALWGDYYMDAKTKRPRLGAADKGKEPLFASMILQNISAIYEALLVRPDDVHAKRILQFLKLDTSEREYCRSDQRQKLQYVMSRWMPLASAVLSTVCEHLPAADQFLQSRAERIMAKQNDGGSSELSKKTERLKSMIMRSDTTDEAPTTVFVAKMIPVEASALSKSGNHRIVLPNRSEVINRSSQQQPQKQVETYCFDADESILRMEEIVFLGFARVFTGRLKTGQQLCLIPDSRSAATPTTQLTISDLYLMMGREYVRVDSVPAGNIVCISGLEGFVLKSATLSASPDCPPLCGVEACVKPIVRVSVEPKQAADLPALLNGLKLLTLSDPCVEAFAEDTGEHVLITVGEVHLQRCLDDLRRRFAVGIDLKVSQPIVPFAETIIPQPKTDVVNEAIVCNEKPADTSVTVATANKQVELKLRAYPLPRDVQELLERNEKLLQMIDPRTSRLRSEGKGLEEGTGQARRQFSILRQELSEVLLRQEKMWHGLESKLWAFGPKRAALNLLVNAISTYDRPSIFDIIHGDVADKKQLRRYDQSVVTGFCLRCRLGPMCEEPIRGVALFVEAWDDHSEQKDGDDDQEQTLGTLTGQIVYTVKEGFRLAFEAHPQRLMLPMYSCTIQATGDVLGKVYAVLNRRGGKVISEEMKEGTNLFEICATLSVVESFGFADELRKRASGLAWPQLVFSHWEVFPVDPFWVPTTEEEILHYGEKADYENAGKKYVNAVRRRKGLPVKEKIVQHAEKQRTLARKV